MKALFDHLRIRQGPSLQERVLGELQKDEEVEIDQVGGADAWVHHARGWTCVELEGYRYMEKCE